MGMGWGPKKIEGKCILMAKSKGKFLLLMKIPIPGVAGWMLFILGSSSGDASDPMRFFLCLGLLCVGWGGGGLWFIHFGATEKDLGYFGLWDCSPFLHRNANVDELDYGIAVHSYTGMQMWMSWTMGLQSIAQTKRHSVKVKQGRQQRREGPCSVLNSESGCVQPTAPLHCNLTAGSFN